METIAARVRLEGVIGDMTDRTLLVALVRRIAPSFSVEGRPDDALVAVLHYAVAQDPQLVTAQLVSLEQRRRTAWESSSPTSSSSTEAPTKRSDALTIDERLAQLERARQDAWKPRAPSPSAPQRRSDESEVDAKLRQLEATRQAAWMPRPVA